MPLSYGSAQASYKPLPTSTEVSCKLTLCLPTRGCFPQHPGQLLFSTVHVRGSVWAEKISLENDEHGSLFGVEAYSALFWTLYENNH
ncbi:hypothetical protein ATANTOWER_029286 [Ataeniobius toweri]|uniref:Uncharacterized protein n=1 Tax=Ataeniobius toweri TaxID=208326 RepID=A0ABU7B5U2_9TELE|nr:hypothetical protein [Ataeniobius toweri]